MKRQHTERAKLITELILEIFRVNGRLQMVGDQLVQPFGQTSSRWKVMGALTETPQTVSQIARSMGLTRQSVQRTIDQMKEEKLIELSTNPEHKKAPLIRLTTKGETIFNKISDIQIKWSNELAKKYTTHQLSASLSLIKKLSGQLTSDNVIARPERPMTISL